MTARTSSSGLYISLEENKDTGLASGDESQEDAVDPKHIKCCTDVLKSTSHVHLVKCQTTLWT